MKSLEEITVERTNRHIERGVNGFTREVVRTYNQKLVVPTIKPGLRCVHLIVDYFILIIIQVLIGLLFGESTKEASAATLIVYLFYPVYYTLMEYKFQQTLGKMLTNTVVINEYAEKPSFRVCLLRTLSRFVPFEPFSCMDTPSRGWHDKWTNTYVVNKNEVPKLKELLTKNNEPGSPASV